MAHRCYRTADLFMTRFPVAQFFRGTSFWPMANDDWGDHSIVDARTFAEFNGSFYGMFRHPDRSLPSNYLRMLTFPIGSPQTCLRSMGVNVTAQHTTQRLRNLSYDTSRQALLAYAAHRQGHTTMMLAGQRVQGWSACPARRRPTPKLALALSRLDGFRFVGLTDDWELSTCLFHAMHGRRPCKSAELVNTRPTAHGTHTADVAQREFARRGFRDHADEALFLAARERFHRDLRAWNVTRALCVELGCTRASVRIQGRSCPAATR
jgi:hypothetical protein